MARNPPSVRLRQNATHNLKREPKKDLRKPKETKKSEPEVGGLVFPGGDTAFKALLSARFCAAIWCHVTDCDETYNYWEPMHYLVFGKGLQTWEYSPEYALRSYTYLLLHATPAFLYHKLLQPNPLLIFYFVRCLLGLLCAFAEVYFYKAVCKEFGVHIGRLTLAFQLFSAGMFISSTALLPSSWAMYAVSAACAAWWQSKYALAIFFIAIASLLGWPFAALLGLPIAFDMLVLKKLHSTFICWSVISAIVILGPMVAIDSSYYGTMVVAPWNIVKYNVLSGHGPELYGTEPITYYIINGFLNFNIVWVFAICLPLALVLAYFFVPAKSPSTLSLPHVISLAPCMLWLAVFLLQPHKEERFLFPIYPLICLCGAVTIDILQKLWFRLCCFVREPLAGSHYLDYSVYITLGTIILSALLSISRILSLYKNYHAPLDLMMELNKYSSEENIPHNLIVNVCLGKDWHRISWNPASTVRAV
ncbi:ALG9 alpha-12-mannosyltransferase [Carabus blaptoides fortunei]